MAIVVWEDDMKGRFENASFETALGDTPDTFDFRKRVVFFNRIMVNCLGLLLTL